MKKLFFAGALALFGAMNAQEFKPKTGDVTVDFGLSGGINNTAVGFADGGVFKARYFKSDKLAYRGMLNLSTESQDGTTNFGLDLGFGMEKHFSGTDRLSPYIGGDARLGVLSNDGSTSTKFGLRGIFGADYYFVKRVFLGVESGLGIGFSSTEGHSSFTIKPELVTGIRLGYAF